MSIWILIFGQAAVLAYALVGGVFLAFSDFIMRSLSLTSGQGGVEAMQVINREVFRWIFMVLFLGMAAMSLLVAAYGFLHFSAPYGPAFAFAGLLYLIGCFGVTVVCNVPMNEALAGLAPDTEDARRYWVETYLPRWTLWNTVRSVACVGSATALMMAMIWLNNAPQV